MSDFARLLTLLLLAGAALTALGGAALWWMEETRRLHRALRKVLEGEVEAVIVAAGRGRAAGFNFGSGQMAVAWDGGSWCLIYRIDELVGAELIVDGQIMARAFRDEPRRALDEIASQADQVLLRLVFDDARHPDFELELWRADQPARRGPESATKAVQAANRWLARAEAILRRHAAWREGPPAARSAAPPFPPPRPDEAPEEQPELFAEAPPWDDEPESGAPPGGDDEDDDRRA